MAGRKGSSQHSFEKGQALVLLVAGMVVLLGFTALAVDGSMVYADRRHAQNAADAASLAGGSKAAEYLSDHHINYFNWNCSGNVVAALNSAEADAITRAASNDFVIDDDISDGHGVDAVCGNEQKGAWYDRYIDVHTKVSADTRTSFIHFVYGGPVRNTVEAVTRLRPRSPLVFGDAIVSLNLDGCSGNQNGVIFSGNNSVTVDGGGIFSNGCMSGNGNALYVAVKNAGTTPVNYAGAFSGKDDGFDENSKPNHIDATLPPDSYSVEEPPCQDPVSVQNPSGYIAAGSYNGLDLKGDTVLEGGGLYCMYGDFDTGNSNVTIDQSHGRTGVTIFLKTGSFITSGNGTVNLNAPPAFPDPSPAIPGILVYLAPGNPGLVKLRGNSTSSYLGVILAPDGRIDAAGTSEHDQTFHTQLIGKDVEIGGNARIDIKYTGNENYQKPIMLELFR